MAPAGADDPLVVTTAAREQREHPTDTIIEVHVRRIATIGELQRIRTGCFARSLAIYILATVVIAE